jgi:hypothetical protein
MHNTDSLFLQQYVGERLGIEVSAGLGSYWEFSGAEWGILGKVGRPVARAQARFMFMAVTPERKIAGGEAPIADAAQAIVRASSWRQRSTPQRMLDDQAFRSLFQASSGGRAGRANPHRRSSRIYEAPESG